MLFLFKINSVAEIGTEERKGWDAAILIGLSDFFLKSFGGTSAGLHWRWEMPLLSGSSVIQKGSSLGTEWQTPVISEAFRSRFSRCSSVADSGDTAIGTSCSDIAEGK